MTTPPITTEWVPVWPLSDPSAQIPVPENGKWLKAEGGAMVWRDPITDADGKWHVIGQAGEPAFQNNWINYNAVNYPPCAFRKLSTGMVALSGLLSQTGWVAGPTSGTIVFTLPVGYRPVQYLHIGTVANDNMGSVRVDTGGGVQVGYVTAGWVALDGVQFWPG
jgi:hypothetical protein